MSKEKIKVYAANGKKYLYDILEIKKETSKSTLLILWYMIIGKMMVLG